MAKSERPSSPARPRVALIVETSLISGREILRGISQYVQGSRPWSIYHEPRSLEASAPAWLKKWDGDAVIARVQNQRIADAVNETGLPAVDVLGVVPETGIPLVHVDNEKIGVMAAEHLLERGFRQFAFCGLRDLNWSCQRRDAFAARVEQAGCTWSEYRLPAKTTSDSSWEKQQLRLTAWIDRLPKPVGVMACYDPTGQKVLEACVRCGAEVPGEVAVVGVDNDQTVCEVCNPPLSSVVANHARVGFEAARLLERLMSERQVRRGPTFIEPTGVAARLSTNELAIGDDDVAEALRFIRRRPAKGLTVQDVAGHVSVSQSTLKERFRRLLGRTVHEEILHTRLAEVRRLLTQTDWPLVKVAQQAGFRHQEYMGVVFKRLTGKTPGQYRKETRL